MKPGDRIEFQGFGEHDPYSQLPIGTLGTVDFIDSLGTVHVSWDNGASVGLVTRPAPPSAGIPGQRPDRYRLIPAKDPA